MAQELSTSTTPSPRRTFGIGGHHDGGLPWDDSSRPAEARSWDRKDREEPGEGKKEEDGGSSGSDGGGESVPVTASSSTASGMKKETTASSRPTRVQFVVVTEETENSAERERLKFFTSGKMEQMMLRSGGDDAPKEGGRGTPPPSLKNGTLAKRAIEKAKSLDLQSLAGSEKAESVESSDAESSQESITPKPRRSTKRGANVTQLRRLHKLLEARKAEFESKPQQEQERLQRAFHKGDPQRQAKLDAEGTRIALGELGISGQCRLEKDCINEVVKEAAACGAINFFEFVFQLVPRAEQKLQEARQPLLHAEFAKFDPTNTGVVSQAHCMEALKQHLFNAAASDDLGKKIMGDFWKGMEGRLQDEIRRMRSRDGRIDFISFLELAKFMEEERAEFLHQSEKRAATMGQVPAAMEKRHFGELARLRHFFTSYLPQDEEHGNVLDIPRCTMALLDSGVLAPVGAPWDSFQRHLTENFEESAKIRFTEFLNFVHKARIEAGLALKETVRKLTPPVNRDDIPSIIIDRALFMDCTSGFAEIPWLVEVANKDGQDAFNDAQLVELLASVSEALRNKARARERRVMRILDMPWDVALALRMQFAELTRTGPALGLIGYHEIEDALHAINPEVNLSFSDIKQLIEEVQEHRALAPPEPDSPTFDSQRSGFSETPPRPAQTMKRAGTQALSARDVKDQAGRMTRATSVPAPSQQPPSTALHNRATKKHTALMQESLNFEGYLVLLSLLVD